MSWQDEPCDQTKLPWCTVVGEQVERVLHCTEFDAWAAARARVCGHRELSQRCATCRGTLKVVDLLGTGSERVRLFPG